MASETRINDAFNKYIRDYLRNVHTIKPAVVTSVSGSRLNANILTKTKTFGTQELQQEVSDVPYQVISGGWGEASITVPIKQGDLVLILFSDRNFGNLRDYTKAQVGGVVTDRTKAPSSDSFDTHGYYPLLAIPCWFTDASDIDIPQDKVVVKYKDKTIELGEKTISLVNGSSSITISDNNIALKASTITLNDVDWTTHTHTGVTSGSSSTGPVGA